MKRIVIAGAMFFIFLTLAYADENPAPLENADLSRQFKINFIHLNPLFFYDNNYSFMDLSEIKRKILNPEKKRTYYTNTQERSLFFNLLLLFAEVIATDAYTLNRQHRGIDDPFLERQQGKLFQ
ncbi:MAG: hypothetical protein LBH20_09250 [Treponema sp.]|jgi:hypothetical protein|nr:hypothetical protein [Treponema sp.]